MRLAFLKEQCKVRHGTLTIGVEVMKGIKITEAQKCGETEYAETHPSLFAIAIIKHSD